MCLEVILELFAPVNYSDAFCVKCAEVQTDLGFEVRGSDLATPPSRTLQTERCACWTWKTPEATDGPRQCMLKTKENCAPSTAQPQDARVSGTCNKAHGPGTYG